MPDDVIARAWQAGRATWPDVALSYDAFADHVQSLDGEAVQRFAADLYLAAACLAGEARAIARFVDEILPGARTAISGVERSPAFVDDCMQRLHVTLLVGDSGAARLAQYAARGPLRAWVAIAATRIALMQRRSQQRAREVAIDDDAAWPHALAALPVHDPELALVKRQYASAFADAFRDAIAALEPRQRTILRMSFAENLSIDEIGDVYAVHRATAARWIQRACEVLFEETRRLLAARLALSKTELDQMAALVRSQLDLSLSQLLPRSLK